MKKIYILFCLLLCQQWLSAQGEMAMNLYANTHLSQKVAPDNSLLGILDQIEKKFNVFFNFDPVLISDQDIDKEVIISDDLNETLDRLLKPLGLIYQKLGSSYYVIFEGKKPEVKEKVEPLPDLPKSKDDILKGRKDQNIGAINPLIPRRSNFSELSRYGFDISGQVTDENGEPLIGVNIQVKGTNTGASTDFEGLFSLEDIDENAVLVVSYIGYVTQEVAVAGKSNISITMVSDSQLLDEVVVVGYGTQKKRDLTGAVSQLNSSTIENENPTNIHDVLRGNIAGLNVGFNASAKGGGSLQVRGRKTLSAGGDPLIVLDGVIYYGSLADVNPNDIETIDVLKDASSAAVYGAKSANGVILINTKKGESNNPQINFSSTVSIAEMSIHQPVNNSNEYINWREDVFKSTNANHQMFQFSDPRNLPSNISLEEWLAYDASSGDPVNVWLQRLNFKQVEIENYKAGKSINWYDRVFQLGIQQDYNVSLSNNQENVSYYFSIGYRDNEGIIVGDQYTSLRGRLNIESNVTNFLTVGINSQFGGRDESQVPVSWDQIINVSPWGNYFDAKGQLRLSPQDDPAISRHPFLNPEYIDRMQTFTNFNASIFTKISLPFKISYQFNYTPYVEWYKFLNHQSSLHPMWNLQGGLATRTQSQTFSWQIDNLVKWQYTVGNIHNIDVTLLANAEKFQSWENSIDGNGFNPSDQLGYHDIGSSSNPIVNSNDQYSTGDALMARIFYSLHNRYLVTLSVRRDGYSAFGQQNPRATFPSLALGWVFTDESFFKLNWLSFGKLRFSSGVNGNRDIGRYIALAGLSSDNYMHIDNNGNVNSLTSLEVSRMSNLNLKWERTTSLNFGLDFSLFRGRMDGTVETYNMKTTDLLVQRTLPSIVGYRSVISNLGEVKNNGFELYLKTRNIDKDKFSWSSTFNFSLNRNTILSLYGDQEDIINENGVVIGQQESNDITNNWFIGQDIDVIWDLKVSGVYQLDELMEANRYGVNPGDIRLVDVDNDGRYSNEDRQFLGYTTPRFRWSFRNEFKIFEDLFLSFMFYSNWGHMGQFNEAKSLGSTYMDRTNAYVLPYWTSDNPINNFARLSSSSGSASYNVYSNKSFIRLDNVSISYSLPDRIISQFKMERAKVSLTCNNVGFYAPGTFLWDPENEGPTPRIYSIGLNLSM